MRRILIAVVAVSAMSTFAAQAVTQPSSRCNGGPVAASKTPAGIGVGASGSTTGGSLSACNNGKVVKAPAKGAATIGGSPQTESVYLDVDGDSNNTGAPCTDGFFRIALSPTGIKFYESKDGSYSDTNPRKRGAQRAKPESAQTFASHTAANCH